MEIKIYKLLIKIDSELSGRDAEKLRGYLGRLFRENPIAHQHRVDGSPIYQYPRVQYKVIDKAFFLIGFLEGEDIVKKVFYELKQLNLEGQWQDIIERSLESYTANFNIAPGARTYNFLTPWLALNENNYEKYQKYATWEKRKTLIENILIGNIISISKSIGYTVPDEICAEIKNIKLLPVKMKDVPMLGFSGTFSVNFDIPDYWGLGKSVAKGFGAIKKCN